MKKSLRLLSAIAIAFVMFVSAPVKARAEISADSGSDNDAVSLAERSDVSSVWGWIGLLLALEGSVYFSAESRWRVLDQLFQHKRRKSLR